MKQILFIAGVFFALTVVSAGADVYSWTDENGVKHYGNVDVSSDAENMKKSAEIKTKPKAPGTGSSPPQSAGFKGPVNTLMKQMQNDPEIMKIILSLQNDPAFANFLTDPAIMKSVQNGDIGALIANPKILKLMNNPKVREINEKMTNKNKNKAVK